MWLAELRSELQRFGDVNVRVKRLESAGGQGSAGGVEFVVRAQAHCEPLEATNLKIVAVQLKEVQTGKLASARLSMDETWMHE